MKGRQGPPGLGSIGRPGPPGPPGLPGTKVRGVIWRNMYHLTLMELVSFPLLNRLIIKFNCICRGTPYSAVQGPWVARGCQEKKGPLGIQETVAVLDDVDVQVKMHGMGHLENMVGVFHAPKCIILLFINIAYKRSHAPTCFHTVDRCAGV